MTDGRQQGPCGGRGGRRRLPAIYRACPPPTPACRRPGCASQRATVTTAPCVSLQRADACSGSHRHSQCKCWSVNAPHPEPRCPSTSRGQGLPRPSRCQRLHNLGAQVGSCLLTIEGGDGVHPGLQSGRGAHKGGRGASCVYHRAGRGAQCSSSSTGSVAARSACNRQSTTRAHLLCAAVDEVGVAAGWPARPAGRQHNVVQHCDMTGRAEGRQGGGSQGSVAVAAGGEASVRRAEGGPATCCWAVKARVRAE